jgi:hypothetical protein
LTTTKNCELLIFALQWIIRGIPQFILPPQKKEPSMSADFQSLEYVYEEVIALMPNKFDSHQFILKLAQMHQRLYVQALVEYAESERPFQIVHGQIAMRLLKFPNLITRVGEHISQDIFLQENTATLWQKNNQ